MVPQETRGRNEGAALAMAAGMSLGVGHGQAAPGCCRAPARGSQGGMGTCAANGVRISNDHDGENWCRATLAALQETS
jgi:hypothetical protein